MSEKVDIFHPDRTGWPPGPWDQEPDRVDFIHVGFSCFVQRNSFGAWCGYVGVPEGHPAYERDYDSVVADVHGGLTYGDRCQGHLCHTPEPGMPADVWWLGFDTGHSWDVVPGMLRYGPAFTEHGSYKDLAYVSRETERLAEQLAEMAS